MHGAYTQDKDSFLLIQERPTLRSSSDFDNIEIGVRPPSANTPDIGTILEGAQERGEVVTKIAYADWTPRRRKAQPPSHAARHSTRAAQSDARR